MFRIKLADEALEDLRFLKNVEQRMVFDAVESQLVFEPAVETRNRKRLRPNPLSTWELRIGKLRVFYDVQAEDRVVVVKAVGWKEHNQLLVRGKEFDL